ncbi:MAG: 3-carboxyethylcatechol 2,3-dioxygenase [Mycobacterium sp.]|jgi:2,3-dihydroxyphenylpropionate 1,2-dioxygenase|nr:3-carboxyethylcatechol 2,3-dioxygenase [Mycobacterium sp.]
MARNPSESMVVCASHSPGMLRDTAAEQGQRFRAGIAEAARRIVAFRPELTVFFGSDHRRAFVDSVPAIAVMAGAAGLGDLGSPEGTYDVPVDVAEWLAAKLLDREFDVTVVRRVALDHGFGQSYSQLLGELSSSPVVPIYLNCATPPLGRPGRAFALGHAIGEELSELGKRVLYVGSGGLSHSPPSLVTSIAGLSDEQRLAMNETGREEAKEKIDPHWDAAFLERLTDDPQSLRFLTAQDISVGGVGANEVRTWIAAVAAGGTPMETIAYQAVPEWITGMAIAASATR